MTNPRPLIEPVADLLRETAQSLILPKWGRLKDDEKAHKAGGEIVTQVDQATEVFLTKRLKRLISNSFVVGEEAVSEDPLVLDALQTDNPVWIVDPIDGTAHFAAGRDRFGILVALSIGDQVQAAWVYHVVADRLYWAVRGQGAYRNNRQLTAAAERRAHSDIRPITYLGFLPEAHRAHVKQAVSAFAPNKSGYCAAYDYPEVITGARGLLLAYRVRPWDHAPGSLLAEEAGAVVRKFDGAAYRPSDATPGLLVAPDQESWVRYQGLFVPPEFRNPGPFQEP